MKTLVLVLEYDGTNYSGWQIQKNSLSIQQEIESALYILTSKKYNIIAAGRTDAGVHAKGQVVSTIIDDFTVPYDKIIYALNSKLPKAIRVVKSKIINEKFHARFDADYREYEYYITTKFNTFERFYVSFIKYPINQKLLFDSAELFIKKYDFTSFSKFNPDTENPVCNVTKCEWSKLERGKFKLNIKADRFLYGMVRSLAGVMVDIARGKRSAAEACEALQKKDRKYNSPLAPPEGLYFLKAGYPKKFELDLK